MRIEVKSTNTKPAREYKGKFYADQQAALHNGGDYPLPFNLNVERGHEVPAGEYTLSPSVFGTDQFGNLIMRRVKPSDLVSTSAAPRLSAAK